MFLFLFWGFSKKEALIPEDLGESFCKKKSGRGPFLKNLFIRILVEKPFECPASGNPKTSRVAIVFCKSYDSFGCYRATLPETNMFSENQWLVSSDEGPFRFWPSFHASKVAVSFREGIFSITTVLFGKQG